MATMKGFTLKVKMLKKGERDRKKKKWPRCIDVRLSQDDPPFTLFTLSAVMEVLICF